MKTGYIPICYTYSGLRLEVRASTDIRYSHKHSALCLCYTCEHGSASRVIDIWNLIFKRGFVYPGDGAFKFSFRSDILFIIYSILNLQISQSLTV